MIPRRWLIGGGLLTLTSLCAAEYDLAQHAWRERLLILVAPDEDDPGIATQQQRIDGEREAVLDRDLVVLQLFSDHGRVGDQPLTAQSVDALRQQLALDARDRALILIGKDGGIKRRATPETPLSEILVQIDAMPIRRNEMEANTKAGPRTPEP